MKYNIIYKVWAVYDPNDRTRYYVVNTRTRRIQSTWLKWVDARDVVSTLNRTQHMDNQVI